MDLTIKKTIQLYTILNHFGGSIAIPFGEFQKVRLWWQARLALEKKEKKGKKDKEEEKELANPLIH